jgi:hypothetical protein
MARLGCETRLKGKIVSAGRYGVSRPAGTISFVLMIITWPAVTQPYLRLSGALCRPFLFGGYGALTSILRLNPQVPRPVAACPVQAISVEWAEAAPPQVHLPLR